MSPLFFSLLLAGLIFALVQGSGSEEFQEIIPVPLLITDLDTHIFILNDANELVQFENGSTVFSVSSIPYSVSQTPIIQCAIPSDHDLSESDDSQHMIPILQYSSGLFISWLNFCLIFVNNSVENPDLIGYLTPFLILAYLGTFQFYFGFGFYFLMDFAKFPYLSLYKYKCSRKRLVYLQVWKLRIVFWIIQFSYFLFLSYNEAVQMCI